MNTPTPITCVQRFIDRFTKLLSGEIIPGRNECSMPYDSEWERDFEWVLSKHLADFITLRNQVSFGAFRADYAFECSKTERIWIVEFDGKSFHDTEKDEIRDQIIFRKNPKVQSIARVDASTGHFEHMETRAMLAQLMPECFEVVYSPQYDWHRSGDVYTAKVFDQRYDEGNWLVDGELSENAPHLTLKIQFKNRP
jgi:hypothetical protein